MQIGVLIVYDRVIASLRQSVRFPIEAAEEREAAVRSMGSRVPPMPCEEARALGPWVCSTRADDVRTCLVYLWHEYS
jgi:hypothetical protein